MVKSIFPTEGRKVGPTLSKAREVGGDDGRTGIGGLPNAVKALALTAKGPWMP